MSRPILRIVLLAILSSPFVMMGTAALADQPHTAAPTLEVAPLTHFMTSTQLAKAYGFSTGDPNCDACEVCRGLAAQAGMGLADLFTFCANTGEPFWICLANQGVNVSMQEASACDDCRLCSFPIEG